MDRAELMKVFAAVCEAKAVLDQANKEKRWGGPDELSRQLGWAKELISRAIQKDDT